jgi:hypothetical protein
LPARYQVAPVVGVDRAGARHPPADIDAGARELVKLSRVVSHQANPGAAKHLQHADGDPVVALIVVKPENAVGVVIGAPAGRKVRRTRSMSKRSRRR